MKYALITGASKGIGKAIAIELAKKGYGILAVARSGDLLHELCTELESQFEVKSHALTIDLTDHDAAQKVYDWVAQHGFSVEILVNNAGFGIWGWFEKQNTAALDNMMQLNMRILTTLTQRFIPSMKTLPQSYILNVSSTTAYQALGTFAVYAASKSYVLSFSRGLRHELRKSSVSVSCLSPGPTDTAFSDRAKMYAMQDLIDKFSMTPEAVAKIAVNGMFNKKAEVIPGFMNQFSAFLAWLMPKKLTETFAANMYEKRLK